MLESQIMHSNTSFDAHMAILNSKTSKEFLIKVKMDCTLSFQSDTFYHLSCVLDNVHITICHGASFFAWEDPDKN